MDVFGGPWENYVEKIRLGFSALHDDDVCVLCGDLAWGMTMEQALPDFQFIEALPGKKILLKGNHDFWWSSLTQVRAAMPDGMYVLQNDSLEMDGIVFCGTRGWTIVGDADDRQQDLKIYRREVIRLEMALKCAARQAHGRDIVALMHYPPFDERQRPSGFTDLLEQYGVKQVVYGHLHGQSLRSAFSGRLRGVDYFQVSCDGLGFKLLELPPIESSNKDA